MHTSEPQQIDIQLLLPNESKLCSLDPEVSIVVPALNEEITIEEFVDWCWEGLRIAGVNGEVIIVDSSSDRTPELALRRGAKVLRTPKRGLGQAYLDAIPFIRGKFIIMGDCDLTYDFREIRNFVESYRLGNEYVMGSRFLGSIEEGAMPSLHRYFGTPLTTWILNKIYHTKYTDIHCGMRGLTKEALDRIKLTSTGWEYASEMVLKAARVGLKIDEVPVTFYKDREGRLSHHRRAGFWSPWFAGWINLKVMLVYSPDSLLIKPGLFLTVIGLGLAGLSLSGNIFLGRIGFGIFTELIGATLAVLGYSFIQVGVLARGTHQLRNGVERYVFKILTYDVGSAVALLFVIGGLIPGLIFACSYITNGYQVIIPLNIPIFGLFLIIIGAQTFIFTLMLEMYRRIFKLKF